MAGLVDASVCQTFEALVHQKCLRNCLLQIDIYLLTYLLLDIHIFCAVENKDELILNSKTQRLRAQRDRILTVSALMNYGFEICLSQYSGVFNSQICTIIIQIPYYLFESYVQNK